MVVMRVPPSNAVMASATPRRRSLPGARGWSSRGHRPPDARRETEDRLLVRHQCEQRVVLPRHAGQPSRWARSPGTAVLASSPASSSSTNSSSRSKHSSQPTPAAGAQPRSAPRGAAARTDPKSPGRAARPSTAAPRARHPSLAREQPADSPASEGQDRCGRSSTPRALSQGRGCAPPAPEGSHDRRARATDEDRSGPFVPAVARGLSGTRR